MAARMKCPQGQEVYRVYRKGVTGWKLTCARDEAHAERRIIGSTKAEIVRPSSYYRELRRQGTYPVKTGRKTRRSL